jgi:hypothetical protein
VRTTAQIAKSASTPKAGRFATLRGLLLGQGSGVSMRTPVLAMMASLCALTTGLFTVAPALALPEGRVYEQVSPVYKGGYGVKRIEAVALNGESVAYYSPGAFDGAPGGPESMDYVARRTAAGWSTSPTMPPPDVLTYVGAVKDVSPSLESTIAFGKQGPNVEAAYFEGGGEQFWLHDTGLPDVSAAWELGGMVLNPVKSKEFLSLHYDGASADFCHLLVQSSQSTLGEEGALTPEGVGALQQVYELNRGCGGEAVSLHPVALNNAGRVFSPRCETEVGVGTYSFSHGGQSSAFNAIAADGREVFFTTCIGNNRSDYQLFVRLSGARTLEVSRPLLEKSAKCAEVPCKEAHERASAAFAGASEDGSRVFFTTTAPLVAGDKDTDNDLYEATIGCPGVEPLSPAQPCEPAQREVTSLVQVSHAPAVREAAEVRGVLRVAPDGSRAYFVAAGVLSEGANVEGHAPVKGAENLYVYERDERYPAGRIAFIGDLCSGKELSGTVEDLRCPSPTGTDAEVWTNGVSEAQTAGADGQFLVFSTYAQLVAGDTDAAKDVYRYDAETGVLDRVSQGEAGYDANGNNSSFDATITGGFQGGDVDKQYELGTRAVSEDGSRIVFTSAEPLSPAATNHLANVYEWHEGLGGGEGEVSLISSGNSEEPVEDVVISPEGRDIFFLTSQGLVAQDTDGVPDIYDARLGGGFPVAAAQPRPCEGDACQGPLTNPAPLLVPGSVSQAPGQNFAAPAPAAAATPKKKATPKCKKGKKLVHGKCVRSQAKRKQTKAKKASRDRRTKP